MVLTGGERDVRGQVTRLVRRVLLNWSTVSWRALTSTERPTSRSSSYGCLRPNPESPLCRLNDWRTAARSSPSQGCTTGQETTTTPVAQKLSGHNLFSLDFISVYNSVKSFPEKWCQLRVRHHHACFCIRTPISKTPIFYKSITKVNVCNTETSF